MRIIFMGSPDFALPALQALIASPEHEVIAVYSQPPRPAGRGQKEQPTAIHRFAAEHGIPVHTPLTLKDPLAQEAFIALQADVAVVAAYGLLLPAAILTGCRLGCINIHPSLLPRWRGAAPIQRTIMAGDSETGIAIMQMDKGLDTGDVLALERFAIPARSTSASLHNILAEKGAHLLLNTLAQLETLTPTPQSSDGITYAHKITKEEAAITWNQPAEVIDNLIRGLTPWPTAYFTWQGENIKVFEADIVPYTGPSAPGTVIDQQLTIACSHNALRPTLIQRPGKKPMDTETVLRSLAIPQGSSL